MVEVKEGMFLMGSRISEGCPEERPMHEVGVGAFFLDRTEVTASAYDACVQAGGCTPMLGSSFLCNGPTSGRGDHPANCVDFSQAEAYCRFVGKRLPSEREWEYAARGGSELRRFSWGDEPPDSQRACYNHPGTCPVGSFPEGAFGLLDMSGNVWEWTSTWFGAYPNEHTSGTHRVYRGGSFSRRFPKWLRNALRNRYQAHEWSASLGMRCARTISPVRCPASTEHRPSHDAEGPPSCERVSGIPTCEPGMEWTGERCALIAAPHLMPASYVGPRNEQRSTQTKTRGNDLPKGALPSLAEAATQETDTVVRVRTPTHDDDCKRHYPGTPTAYQFKGGTFHGRNPMIRAGGCVRRDMGEHWTSACCP
ncbi:SUMF1/EgtB/PvdO family nonheme iron enzyme [Chondromyces crocatus]